MSLPISSHFATQKEISGYRPVFLVEIPSAGVLLASRAIPELPAYTSLLAPIAQGGIGHLRRELAEDNSQRVGNTQIRIVNPALFSALINSATLDQQDVHIKLGFLGGQLSDYTTIFQGVIDRWDIAWDLFTIEALDGTFRRHKIVQTILGELTYPATTQLGAAAPLLLGHVPQILTPLRVTGTASSSLAQAIDTSQTYCYLTDVSSPFPSSGSILIGSETITYTGRTIDLVDGAAALKLTGLTRGGSPSAAAKGTAVTLTGVVYTWLIGHQVAAVYKTSAATTYTLSLAQAEGGKHYSVLSRTSDVQPSVYADGANITSTNLVSNGGAESASTTGWTTVEGTLEAFSSTVAPEGSYYFRLTLTGAPSTGKVYQDVTTVIGARYLCSLLYQRDQNPSMFVRLGTTSDEDAYFDSGTLIKSGWQRLLVAFTATDTTTRLTIGANSAVGGVSAFDAVTLRASDENPAATLAWLIDNFLPGITRDTASFASAATYLAGWRFAGVLDHPEDSRPLLTRLAEQCRSLYIESPTGAAKLLPYDPSAASEYAFTTANIVHSSLTVTQGPLDLLYTEIYLYYNRLPSAGTDKSAYAGLAYASPSTDTHSTEDLAALCNAALTTWGRPRRLDYLADLIPDGATAEKLLAYLVKRHTTRPIVVTFRSWLNGAHLSVGDIITITHPLIPTAVNGAKFQVRASSQSSALETELTCWHLFSA
jgi:hypothetical protein